jgi:hypothetical protein
VSARRPQSSNPPPVARSPRYWLPDPHPDGLSPLPLTLLQHLVEVSDTLVNLDGRPSNLALGLFTHAHPLSPSPTLVKKISMCRRARHESGLTRLGAPMFHFKTYRPAFMIVSRSKNESELCLELCAAAKGSKRGPNLIKTCSNAARWNSSTGVHHPVVTRGFLDLGSPLTFPGYPRTSELEHCLMRLLS